MKNKNKLKMKILFIENVHLNGIIQRIILCVNVWFYFVATSDWANITYMIIDKIILNYRITTTNYIVIL
jgi:hypothetical protein